ncbi:T9SS type A sorting domain-containing protein [Bacteroides salyersiae]|nr:T9SS type A sorting domain-containing protein [Bacteroides salyersiae]
MSVANKVLPAGNTTISNLPEGMYLLKATNQNGAVSISKLMVK